MSRRQLSVIEHARIGFQHRMRREHWHDWSERPPEPGQRIELIRFGWRSSQVTVPEALHPTMNAIALYWRPAAP